MKRVIKEEFPYVISLLLIFLIVAVLSVFLIRGEYRRNLLLTEYEAEKIAGALLESFMENRVIEPASLSEDISCFGIYDYSGKAIRSIGSAPAYFQMPAEGNKSISFDFNRVNRTLTLIRRIGFLPERMRMFPMPMMHLRTSPPQFLLLQLKIRDYWVKQSFYRFSMIVVPLFIAGIVVFIGYLYKKNRTYRKNIESQKQLVQLGEIARTLSYEIKNPLSAIRIQTGILKRVLPEDKADELTVIEQEVQRLNLLTEKIGDFLRDPRGNPDIIDVEQFLNNLIPRFEREVEFQFSGAGRALINFDRERLRSVLENLIKNGLESGGKDAEVRVILICAKTGIEIIVLDRGDGIAPEMEKKIFDPFFTSKMKGSGIGLSSRGDGPFIAINIGGIPEALLESELFGYEKGAFTDAVARIISATNRNLDLKVSKGEFREDLFYRLNVVRIEMPPLRERKDDIPLIVGQLLKKLKIKIGKEVREISAEALMGLQAYDFPGNIRELENIIERACIFTEGRTIQLNDLQIPALLSTRPTKPSTLKDSEKRNIIEALHRWEGNRTRSAAELGITRKTLWNKIKEYGLDI